MADDPQQLCATGSSSQMCGRPESRVHILKVSEFEDGGRRDKHIKSCSGKGQSKDGREPDGPSHPKKHHGHDPPANTDR